MSEVVGASVPEPEARPETASAARQLEDYLNDTLAPLQVADRVVDFLSSEPEEANRVILRWADQQLNLNLHAIPISDLLYHALKKIQIFEDLGLADADRIGGLLATAAAQARSFCPKDELIDFDTNLARLRENSKMLRTVELLHRAGLELDDEASEPGDETEGGEHAEDLDSLRRRVAEGREGARRREPREASQPKEAEQAQAGADDNDDSVASTEPAPFPDHRSAELLATHRKRHPDLASIRQEQVALGLKRFSMLVDTLERATRGPKEGDGAPWTTHLLSSAALGARNHQEFRDYLDRLKRLGLQDLHMEQLVRSVAETLPDWYLEGDSPAQPESAATVAMERIVDLTEHEAEKSERLKEIVAAAVEHFNRRRLGSALTLFELAERLLKSSELASKTEKQIRASARSKLLMGPFRKYVASPEKHPQLRRVLNFFPDLRVEGLVRRLLKEANRRNRHLIMDLLRIHGQEAREAVAELVISSTTLSGREWPWFFVRNLIRILREVPAQADAVTDFELDAVVSYADPIHAIQVVREAVAYLGTVVHPRALEALVHLFHGYREAAAGLRRGAGGDMAKIQSLTLTYLLRADSPHARATALDAILAGSRRSPENFQLLSVLGSVNLAEDHHTLDRLLSTIRLRLPREGVAGTIQALRMHLPQEGWLSRMRGFGPTKEAALQALLQALSGTPTPAVNKTLTQVEELAPTENLVRIARKARKRLEEKSFDLDPSSESILSGDLEIFGLPNIIQSLKYNEASGTLVIEAKQSSRHAAVRLLHGRFVDAKAGALRGAEAFYLLMERPLASSFRFVADASRQASKNPQELKALLFEGMRRRDEFERLRLLVPDGAVLQLVDAQGGQLPKMPLDEADTELATRIWSDLNEGPRTTDEIDSRGFADPYRIRKLLAFWVEGKLLRIREPGARQERL